MSDGEDWLWRPVAAGLCLYREVKDGSLSLEDIAIMNEILDVKAINEHMYYEAME